MTGATTREEAILIVDDEPANVTLLQRMLHQGGHTRIATLTDPRQVVSMFEADRFDLVLLDLHMPHLDGIEVMGQIQDLLPDDAFVPVVILTADTADTTRERALEAGASDFLTKPFDRAEVLLRVTNLLERRRLHEQVRSYAADLEAQVATRTRELTQANQALAASKAELERLYDEAIELDRIKSDFVAVASHEVRTPVAVMVGFAELLIERGASMTAEQRTTYLQSLATNAHRLERLLKNLLAASHVELGNDTSDVRVEWITLLPFLDEVATATLDESSKLTIEADPDLSATADPNLLEQILVNLLTNAQRYGSPPITITAETDGEAVTITVADNGAGVPDAVLPSLFTRFAQTGQGDRRSSGVGLGLWIVARLTEMHGGDAFHEPNQPHGARFGVRLPTRDTSADPTAPIGHGR